MRKCRSSTYKCALLRKKDAGTCNKCGNTGHTTANCALLRKQDDGNNINYVDEDIDTISTIHDDEKNARGLTENGNTVSPVNTL